MSAARWQSSDIWALGNDPNDPKQIICQVKKISSEFLSILSPETRGEPSAIRSNNNNKKESPYLPNTVKWCCSWPEPRRSSYPSWPVLPAVRVRLQLAASGRCNQYGLYRELQYQRPVSALQPIAVSPGGNRRQAGRESAFDVSSAAETERRRGDD